MQSSQRIEIMPKRLKRPPFPKLSPTRQRLADRITNPENLHRLFIVTCKRIGLPRATQDRIEHEFKSQMNWKSHKIADQWKGKAKWSYYLQKCLENITLNAIRQTGKHVNLRVKSKTLEEATLQRFVGINAPEIEDPLMRAERIRAIREGLAKLSKDDAEVIRLALFEGKKMKEIAAVLGVPEGTVKRRLHYAKKKLRKKLEHDPRIFP